MKLKIKFGLLGAALLAASATAQAETITLKVEHFLGPQTISTQPCWANGAATLSATPKAA